MPVNKTRRKMIQTLPLLPALGAVGCVFNAAGENKMNSDKTNPGGAPDLRSVRPVSRVIPGMQTSDGAGVRLKRYIGSPQLDYLDPFLMLDEFSSDNPNDYMAGFPPHPHRGMETVTYMVDGRVEHGDSLGNKGVIGKGDAQWMTAGSGIIHSEMPAIENGLLRGLQLWVNLPAKDKMNSPKYRELKSDAVPTVRTPAATVRIIAGGYLGTPGAFSDIAGNPMYLDVFVEKGEQFQCELAPEHNGAVFVLEGTGQFGASKTPIPKSSLGVLERSDKSALLAIAGDHPLRFILIAAAPLNEPVARGGPFVMNTQAEIEDAWREYQQGTFIKQRALVDERKIL